MSRAAAAEREKVWRRRGEERRSELRSESGRSCFGTRRFFFFMLGREKKNQTNLITKHAHLYSEEKNKKDPEEKNEEGKKLWEK